MIRLLLSILALLVAVPASAEALRANPTTLSAVLKAAKPGDVITLDQNRLYGDVALPIADHDPPVTIEAWNTKLRSLAFRGTAGWKWLGGTVDSPPLDPPYDRYTVWRNVIIQNAKRIELASTVLTGGETGVLVTGGSEDIMMRGNLATGLRSDGFNIATAKRVSLIGNVCRDFRPILAIYDAAGKQVKDGTHPDCIMLWSEAGKEPTSDILISGNVAKGAMQGISHFWHQALGRDKVYRVRAWDNDVEVSYFWGIALANTPGSDIRFNRVATIPGAVDLARPTLKITTYFTSDPDAVRCGNTHNGVDEPSC